MNKWSEIDYYIFEISFNLINSFYNIYTEKYSLFNRDTVVYKYSKPICYSGVCVAKNKFRTYNGAARTSALFKQVTIFYKNKEWTLNNYYIYDNLEIGDTCLVIEYFYPYRETKIELYSEE